MRAKLIEQQHIDDVTGEESWAEVADVTLEPGTLEAPIVATVRQPIEFDTHFGSWHAAAIIDGELEPRVYRATIVLTDDEGNDLDAPMLTCELANEYPVGIVVTGLRIYPEP